MDSNEHAWSLSEAFPWLHRYIFDNFLIETYDLDADYGAVQTRDTSWDNVISAPVLDLEDSKLEELISKLGLGHLNLNFGALFPFLPGTLEVASLGLSVRPYNCLRREGYNRFADLSRLGLEDIKDIRNLGSNSTGEIFESLFRFNIKYAIEAWTSGIGSIPASIHDTTNVSNGIKDLLNRAEVQKRIASAFDEIARWTDISNETKDFSLLEIDLEILEGESREMLSKALHTLRDAIKEIEKSAAPLFGIFATLDVAAQDVISRRICAEQKMSLQELGDVHSISRERIRQLENNAKQVYRQLVEGDSRLKYLVAYLKTKVKPLEFKSAIVAKFPNASIYSNLGELSDVEIIFGFEPSIHVFDGLFSAIGRDELEKSIIQISKSNASVGLLSEAAFIDLLDTEIGNGKVAYEFGVKNQLFELRAGLIIPVRTGLTELAILTLASKGKPMRYEQLAEIVINGRSERSFRNALFADQRLKRTSLTDWALAEWDVDEYTNIKDEILEVLDEVESIAMGDLVEMLTSKYGVSASSVAAYASAWPFQNINGLVSKSDSSQVSYARPMPNQKELLNIHGDILIRLRFGSEQERGSGSNVSKAVAAFLGLNHGDVKEFDFPSQNLSLKLSYVGLQPSLGSVRDLALKIGAELGDNLFISLGKTNEIYRRDGSSSLSISDLEEFLDMKIGDLPKHEIRKIFAQVLSLDPAETFPAIFSALRNRGEFELESDIRGLIGDNQAFDLEVNLKTDSKFRIAQIDDV
jgi:hypothetical protein